jgi:UDP-glucose 4-epimerase
MTKNIFLPGGIGYIGSHVMIELLLHTDFHLTVADNFFNSSEENLEAIFECVREEILTNFNLKQVQ